MSTTFVVLLMCKHARYYEKPCPEVGEVVMCRTCGNGQAVTATEVEYHLKCRGCRYGRPFGTAQVNAELSAMRHRRKAPGHVVDILLGDVVVQTFGARDRALQTRLPVGDEPPF